MDDGDDLNLDFGKKKKKKSKSKDAAAAEGGEGGGAPADEEEELGLDLSLGKKKKKKKAKVRSGTSETLDSNNMTMSDLLFVLKTFRLTEPPLGVCSSACDMLCLLREHPT